MIHCPNYSKATNAAYQLLVKKRTFSLATDVFSIVEDLLDNCKILSYGQACVIYGYSEEQLLNVSEFGFSFIKDEKRIILYNETVPLGAIRFTIAHEIGHAVLGHSEEHDEVSEKEANCFARNLLCPIPVVHGFGVEVLEDYVRIFNVTSKMARVAFNWKKSDKYYIESDLYNTVSDMLDAYMLDFTDIDEYYQFLAS